PAAAAAAPAAATQVTVVEAVVARSVVDRQPQDTGAAFPADVGQLNCWTKLEGAGGSSIHHVWFHGDTQAGDVELQVGGSPRPSSRRFQPPPVPVPAPSWVRSPARRAFPAATRMCGRTVRVGPVATRSRR